MAEARHTPSPYAVTSPPFPVLKEKTSNGDALARKDPDPRGMEVDHDILSARKSGFLID